MRRNRGYERISVQSTIYRVAGEDRRLGMDDAPNKSMPVGTAWYTSGRKCMGQFHSRTRVGHYVDQASLDFQVATLAYPASPGGGQKVSMRVFDEMAEGPKHVSR